MSGSPIPRLITSIPAALFAETLRSISANMYGGIACSSLDGSVSATSGLRLGHDGGAMRFKLSAGELATLFLIGAVGGLIGDAGHVQSGTTTYLDDTTPFVWRSALWFPILVGLATASLGELRLRLGPARPGFDPRTGVAAIAAVL